MFNQDRAGKFRCEEHLFKLGKTSRTHEPLKTVQEVIARSYLEPVQVPLAEKAKAWQENQSKGIRQVSPVTSGEGVPTFFSEITSRRDS